MNAASDRFPVTSRLRKFLYHFLAIFQLALIYASSAVGDGICAKDGWEIAEEENRPLEISCFLLLLWLLAVIFAAVLGVYDRRNRPLIFLFLVVLLPYFEFCWWIANMC